MAENSKIAFTEGEMEVDECLGYPRAYTRLCRDPDLVADKFPYSRGPPSVFVPYAADLKAQETLKPSELNQMFPVINLEEKPSVNPKAYVSLLWKQLSHLGNAGFDPANFRVDPYGNVLYFHADSASPLAWEIDHWFPLSRGGKTVPSNLRILQWQVSKRKHNKLEILVPWWDLQLGISVNQFLSIFASRNSDFRNRAFSFLFFQGEGEELNSLQTVDSHTFPHHFNEMKRQIGLAPAAIVFRNSDQSPLKTISLRRPVRPSFPSTVKRFSFEGEEEASSKAIQKLKTSISKENDDPNMDTNPYLAISKARDSFRRKEEYEKKRAEVQRLEDELSELKQKNETERIALQDMETMLIKKRRRVEKCRRLAEAQSSHRALLEKMIRDAMHQSVVYKEQVRLNQAATNALMARLEAQKAICDTAERELHRRFRQRDEIEKQIRPSWEKARKRSRINDSMIEEIAHGEMRRRSISQARTSTPLAKKELRKFLEEELKESERDFEGEEIEDDERVKEELTYPNFIENEVLDDELKRLTFDQGWCHKTPCEQEDNEDRKERGKGNVEKWLQILLENAKEGSSKDSLPSRHENHTQQVVQKLNLINPQEEIKYLKLDAPVEVKPTQSETGLQLACMNGKEKEKMLVRSSSSRTLRLTPSSPLMIFGMRRGVDCIGKKPLVMGEDEGGASCSTENVVASNKLIKTCTKAIKKAVKT